MQCQYLRDLADWRTENLSSPPLRHHLFSCPSCRETVAKWQVIEHEIVQIDQESSSMGHTDVALAAQRLVWRARQERRHRRHGTWTAFGGLAVAAGIATLVAFSFFGNERPGASIEDSAPVVGQSSTLNPDGQIVAMGELREGQQVFGPPGGKTRLVLGGDTIVLAADSLLRIDAVRSHNTRLVLERGQMACAVEHRRSGESFEVVSGAVRVQVVGTRFGVTRLGEAAVTVAVDDGEVAVLAGTERHAVRRGHGLRIDGTGEAEPAPLSSSDQARLSELLDLEPPPVVEAPRDTAAQDTVDLDFTLDGDEPVQQNGRRGARPTRKLSGEPEQWRTSILEGRLDEARAGLTGYLAGHPRDADAWFLLADCERKSGRWRPAVEAYQRIGELGSPKEQQRASFRGGAILQDKLGDQRQAAVLFERYVAQSGGADTLKPEAMLRLARAYRSLGRSSEANRLLETVVADHGGTSAASQARDLLQPNR